MNILKLLLVPLLITSAHATLNGVTFNDLVYFGEIKKNVSCDRVIDIFGDVTSDNEKNGLYYLTFNNTAVICSVDKFELKSISLNSDAISLIDKNLKTSKLFGARKFQIKRALGQYQEASESQIYYTLTSADVTINLTGGKVDTIIVDYTKPIQGSSLLSKRKTLSKKAAKLRSTIETTMKKRFDPIDSERLTFNSSTPCKINIKIRSRGEYNYTEKAYLDFSKGFGWNSGFTDLRLKNDAGSITKIKWDNPQDSKCSRDADGYCKDRIEIHFHESEDVDYISNKMEELERTCIKKKEVETKLRNL